MLFNQHSLSALMQNISLLQHTNDVQTRQLRLNRKKSSRFLFLSLCQKDTQRQRLQRPSIALASNFLFLHDSDLPTLGFPIFPRVTGVPT